jgi:chaperonin GroES
MTECPIIPMGDRIVILPLEEGEQTYGNIVVPDMGKEKPEIGTVLAVGPGRVSTDGTLIPNKIEVGQTVMVPKFGAQVVELNREKYIMASENDVLGIIKQKEEKNEN